MAKLKAIPKNFEQAVAVLGNRYSMRLGNNTYLERLNGDQQVAVRLYSTYIVRFYQTGRVTLHTGGYGTVTTKDRINQFITGRVYQKNHEWFYVGHNVDGAIDWDNPIEFSEGMEVNRKPRFDYSRRCECGAPWDNDTQGFRCANK